MKIDLIAGARPNFIKIAPLIYYSKRQKEQSASIEHRLVHTKMIAEVLIQKIR